MALPGFARDLWLPRLGPLTALVLLAAVTGPACAGDDANGEGSLIRGTDSQDSITAPLPTATADTPTAPDFTLPDATGSPVSLETLLKENRRVVIIFYRGFF